MLHVAFRNLQSQSIRRDINSAEVGNERPLIEPLLAAIQWHAAIITSSGPFDHPTSTSCPVSTCAMHAVAWICNFVGHSHRFSNLCWWVRPRVNIRHPRTLPGGSQGCADRILEQTVLHTYPQQLAGSGLRRYRSERVHTPHRHRRPAATPSGMAPSIDHVQRGAGHTVIEARK